MKINESRYLPWSGGATPPTLPANNPLLTLVEREGERARLEATDASAPPQTIRGIVGRALAEARRGEALGTAQSAMVARRVALLGGAAALIVVEATGEAHRSAGARPISLAGKIRAYPQAFRQSLGSSAEHHLRDALHISARSGIPSAAATLGAVAGSVTAGPAVAAVLVQAELTRGLRRLLPPPLWR